MEALGQQYGAPLADEAKKFSTSAELGGVRSAGRALTHPKAGAIPQERRQALMQVGCGVAWGGGAWAGLVSCPLPVMQA